MVGAVILFSCAKKNQLSLAVDQFIDELEENEKTKGFLLEGFDKL